MITEQDLLEAIDECKKEKNPNARTCMMLAAFYIILDHMEDDVVLPQYSYAVEPEDKVTYNNRSEFAKQIHGKEMGKVLEVIDELMSTLKILHPKLYDGVMMKIAE